MKMSSSQEAKNAYALVRELQERFANKLEELSETYGQNSKCKDIIWLRDNGTHGGGSRFEIDDKKVFNTASVNVSHVHYDYIQKRLKSATALSAIIHPSNPHAPSMHIHISYTELRGMPSFWRIMADLNPSIVNKEDKEVFDNALRTLGKNEYETALKQADEYFMIPALNKTRGVSHFYLENYKTDDAKADFEFAKTFGEGVIDTYIDIVKNTLNKKVAISQDDMQKQLDYHTLYLFQVLTLDQGTTAGLLVHNQNDLGIMGSLPSCINKQLLLSWKDKVVKPQDELVQSIADAIADDGIIDIKVKQKLAQCVRQHYKKHKDATSMQASGPAIPNVTTNK